MCDARAVEQIAEFPFVEAMPKREKSRLARVWEQFQLVREAVRIHGALIPQSYAKTLLDLSKQRVHQLVNEGKLTSIDLGGVRYVTEKSILAWAEAEHKTGRPVKVPSTKTILKGAWETTSTDFK